MTRIFSLLLLLCASPIWAADAESEALLLADYAVEKIERTRDLRLFLEAATAISDQGLGPRALHTQRLSLNLDYDKVFYPGWRAVLSDRIDINWQDNLSHHTSINTLKEAYVSWQVGANQIVDLGSINARNGVATGYNPTDFFRSNTSRSVVSVDPINLKKNRLGSVMLRGQTLWAGGSMTALYSPKLSTQSQSDALITNTGTANQNNRWLVAASHTFFENFNPQFLVFSTPKEMPQFGLNLTGLINDATVGFFEWSGGRSPSVLSQALNTEDDSRFRNKLATGITYTTENKLILTCEYEYNGSGLESAAWDALQQGSPLAYWRYRQAIQHAQDLPTKQAVFFYGIWQDALIKHLDFTAMVRTNLADHSRMQWIEMRYHADHIDFSLQWQLNSGNAGSDFGALATKRNVQAQITYYF